MDRNLRACSRKGHLTYTPAEPQFRTRLEAATPLAAAPVLLRGKALRAAFVLRALAIERWVRGLVLLLLVNVAAVLYLILGKRLFGLRGGHAACGASLLEVEEAAAVPPPEPLAATP